MGQSFLSKLRNEIFYPEMFPLETIGEDEKGGFYKTRFNKIFRLISVENRNLNHEEAESFFQNWLYSDKDKYNFHIIYKTKFENKIPKNHERSFLQYKTEETFISTDFDGELPKNANYSFCSKEYLENFFDTAIDYNSVVFNKNFILHKNKYFSILSLIEYPERISNFWEIIRENLPPDSEVHVHIKGLDQQNVKLSLDINAHAKSVSIQESLVQEGASRALHDIESGREKIFGIDFKILIKADTEKELNYSCQYLTDVINQTGAKAFREIITSKQAFTSILPASYPQRFLKIQLSDLSGFLPITQTGYKSENVNEDLLNSGKLLLNRRDMTLTEIDLFADYHRAAHTFIMGKSGSGKSFLVNLLLQSIAKHHNAKCTIIDVGSSFKGMFDSIGGQEIEIDKCTKGFLNPFYGINIDEENDDNNKADVSRISKLFEALILEENELSLSREDQLALEQGIQEAFNQLGKKNSLYLDTVVSFIPKNLRVKLGSWYGAGRNSNIFLSSDSKNLKAKDEQRFIYYNLAKINQAAGDKEFLQGVFAGIICSLWGRFKVGEPHVIIIDESPLFLQKSSGLINSLLSTLRKEGAILVLCTQTIKDFIKFGIQTENFGIKCLYSNDSAENFQDLMKLSDEELSNLNTLKMNRQERYSEFLYKDDVKTEIMSLVPSAREYWLSTTHQPEKEIINKFLKQNFSHEEACFAAYMLEARSR